MYKGSNGSVAQQLAIAAISSKAILIQQPVIDWKLFLKFLRG